MSIVEKALKKLQGDRRSDDGRSATGPDAPFVFGRLIEQYEAVAPERPAARAPTEVRPSKIVHVDRDALRNAGMLPPGSQEHELADQYRVIKLPLIRNAFGPAAPGTPPAKLIMLASALPGDGKTFTCINLSLSMSLETDHTVLVVDADAANPYVSRVFGVQDEPGLLDVLADPTLSIESVVLQADVPGLRILPAGRRSETATELLASRRCREVVGRLAELYPRGIVLFDTSPILLTSEARVLASLVGQVVIVVKAGETPQQALKDTIDILGTGKRISLVLNQAEMSGPMSYYYGHRYGYKQSVPDRPDSPA